MLRLHRIRLTDFKGVAARELEFAEHGVTLVSGPNEIGKSSLVDALDLLIDLRASSRHSRVVAAQPTGRDVGPCVEAELTLGAHRIVYRKRWLRSPLTELQILTPNPEQHAGDQAHERFNGLLDENGVDKELWRRLRVDQGAPLGQASVGGYASVPAMRGESEPLGSVRRGPEEGLFEKAKTEFEKYFTERKNLPTGDYKAAIEAHEKASAAYAEAKATLAEAESDLANHQRTRRQLAEGAEQLEAARARLGELEQQQKDAVEAQTRLHGLDAELTEAEAIERQHAEVERLDGRLAENEAEAEAKRQELEAAEREAVHAEELLRTYGAEREAAKDAARRAGRDVEWRQDQAEAEQAEAVLERVEAAGRRLAQAEAALAECRVTDEVLARIDAAHRAWEKAHDQLTANAATLTVTRLGDAPVLVDGSACEDAAPLPVLETRTVEVPGARVVVKPGSGEKARRAKERETAELYRELAAESGVADIAAAREAERAWRAAREERQGAAAAVEAAQYDESADQLRARLVALRTRIAAYRAEQDEHVDRSGEQVEPADLAAARQAAQSALAAVGVAQDRWERQEAVIRRLETRISTLRAEQAAAARAVRDATVEQELATKRLVGLGTLRGEAELAAVREERDAAARQLARLDPERLAGQLANQRRLVPELEHAQNQRGTSLEVLADRLERYGRSAPEEQLALAEAEHQRAQRTRESLERRARAAKLLFETLGKHREAARRRHTSPFRQRVERYAQRLYGQQVRVEIGADLTIVSKTDLTGTVSFDGLSAGAREQLSLLARIACADLVGSVPLILDDVLGHSDRDRLEDIAVILGQVADRTQIILLSHDPTRFPIAGIRRIEL
jgi:DNA repair exonuclease SbcCD ATPase subunit